ncbi:MAG: hypothetical protein V7607_183 [Solirubrobacteraceae bacterium]
MHPTTFPGRAGLAPLPPQEWHERVAALAQMTAERGLAGLAIYGDARECAALAYVSGFLPMMGFAVALVPVRHEPSLYLGLLGGDALRRLTWIDDVQRIDALADAVDRIDGDVALAGAGRMRAGERHCLGHVVGGGDELVDNAMREPRPRELELLHAAAALTKDAADVAEAQAARGASVTDALVAAELHAREAGARDVRLLYGAGNSLRPLDALVDAPATLLPFYLALELDGYWGEALRTAGADLAEANARLDAATRELSLGAQASTAAHVLACEHPVVGRHPVAQLGPWNGGRAVDGALGPGVYSLRSAVGATVLSRTVELAGRVEVLA